MKSYSLLAIAFVSFTTATAHAHIQLTYPPQRYADQKYGPCGSSNDTGRGDTVTVFRPGDTITVTWDETINHPGHFRISFDSDGQDDFVDPDAYDDYYSADSVIADNIDDTPNGGESSYQITLPDIECNNCTLQVVQVMTDKQPYGDGNDLYYQCADITLSYDAPDAGPSPDAGPTPDPDDGGCQSGPGSTPGTAALVLLVLAGLVLMRRRGSRQGA